MTIMFNRRQFLTGAMCAFTALALPGCGGGGASTDSSKREYVDESEIDAVFASPDEYKGKWIKLPGKCLGYSEQSGDITAFQAYYDVTTYERTYLVHTETNERFYDGEYVLVDGMIDGTFKGENALGTTLTLPLISNATVTESTYIDAVVPTKASIEPAVTATQNDVTFTCDKVEFADTETRVYLTVANNSAENIGYGVYSIRAIVDGQQIEQDQSGMSVYEGGYPTLSYDVTPGATTSGIVVFPAIEPGTAFKLIIPDIYSDNYEISFTDVELEIPA